MDARIVPIIRISVHYAKRRRIRISVYLMRVAVPLEAAMFLSEHPVAMVR